MILNENAGMQKHFHEDIFSVFKLEYKTTIFFISVAAHFSLRFDQNR